MIKWFVLDNNLVSGPLSSEQVLAQIDEGFIPSDALIWGRPQQEWFNIVDWTSALSNIGSEQASINQNTWHYAFNDESFGPFTRAELIKKLSLMNTQNLNILIWTKGMDEWASLFDFHDIVMDLSIDVRKHPRIPISGTATLSVNDNKIVGDLCSISEGGMGIRGIKSLTTGQEILLDIDSSQLNKKFRIKAKVKYIGDNHYAGLQYDGISAEAKSSIIEYIKNSVKESKMAA
ncbi:MAG: DUF4339 domain-containing protein [Bdellovibrionaceae bacterium]|jgi:hypothetical protein|nr:DUF4339 domain-containing protein [Pseudobdellovibrionaceae bacterium]